MATRETAANRRALAQGVKLEQHRLRHEAHAELRTRIAHIHARRKALASRVRAQCKRARLRVREAIKARRVAAREALRIEVDQMRQAERNRCRLRHARVKHESEGARARAERERRERRIADAASSRIERHRARQLAKHARAEARGESDDEVRSNLEDELVPIFNVVRAKMRPRPGMSRTEAFLHWAEEHPEELWAMREDLAERRLRALVAEEKRARRQLPRGGARARRAALEPAPF